jgi:hypothetical protein
MSDRVECPRCEHNLNARLHAIFSTDAQECPRCKARDGLEIPMFLMPKVAPAKTVKMASGWHLMGRRKGD